jgi:hypothetical protein
MMNVAAEKTLTRLISIGSAVITIFIMSGSVTDPVNSSKLLILGIVACGTLGVVLRFNLRSLIRTNRFTLLVLTLFVLMAIASTASSELPFVQNLYGLYGRNSGLYTYLFLAVAPLGSLSITQIQNLQKIIYGLGVAGLVNVVYSLWVITFGDFVGWANPFGNILGTLGNPNFIGAFLGMFFSVLMAYVFNHKLEIKVRVFLLAIAGLTFFEIYDSRAIQGRVVAALGLAVVGFFFIRSKFTALITWGYTAVVIGLGALAGLGALQIGPLTGYIYKYSVSLRGQYWLAGWNTGESHPLLGVGMDGFGDWYRRSRDVHALSVPGVNTVVNAAHNVFLDMFAFGGWPLFISYIAIVVIGAISLVKVAVRSKTYDPIFTAIAVAWLGYQLQSVISINQIGLAIWGWVLTGALIAYERNTRNSNTSEVENPKNNGKKVQKKTQGSVVSSGLIAGVGMVVGAVIASPPLASDMKWRSAQLSQSAEQTEAVLAPSFMNPPHSLKYLTSIQSFESSNLPELAHKYAVEAVKFNPENFDLWKVFYLIQASTPEEKALALENMKRLDPLNPDVTAR